MYRIVIDTSVIATALRSATGAGNALLRLVAQQQVKSLLTPALFFEYEDVLKRPEQRLITGLDAVAIDRFLAAFASASEAVVVHFYWRPQLRDAADEMVLEAAINGRADALVTYNIRDFLPAAQRFGLRVMLPGELLKEMRNE